MILESVLFFDGKWVYARSPDPKDHGTLELNPRCFFSPVETEDKERDHGVPTMPRFLYSPFPISPPLERRLGEL